MACSLLINAAHALCFHQRKRAYRVTNYIQFLVWKKRTRKIVRVPERLYHLVLIHFYQPRYDYAVCTQFKVYPKSLGLSRDYIRIQTSSKNYIPLKLAICSGERERKSVERGPGRVAPHSFSPLGVGNTGDDF